MCWGERSDEVRVLEGRSGAEGDERSSRGGMDAVVGEEVCKEGGKSYI